MKQYDLEKRLIDFASLIIDVQEALPPTKAGNHLGGQILRSGTAPALQYGEAQAAESKADFLHKVKIALKELRETQINLRIIEKRQYLSSDLQAAANDECSQLVAIFTKTVETAKKNA
jgi:four helix bundle protein